MENIALGLVIFLVTGCFVVLACWTGDILSKPKDKKP